MPSNIELLGWDEIEGLNDAEDVDAVLGDYLLSGDDDDTTILGAAASPTVKKALAARKAQRGTLLKTVQPRKSRHLPLGIDSGAVLIAAGVVQVITVTPQKPFRLERLVVDPTAAPSFLIQDVRVGTDSQFVTAGSVPASIFVPNAMAVALKGDTCQPGISITLTVQNFSGAAARFLGALIGTAIGY